jgi:hypothetical protein
MNQISSTIFETQKKLASALEAELREAIKTKLGDDSWAVNELAGRLQVVRFNGTPADFYYLDGAAILQVGVLIIESGRATRSINRL